MENENKLIAEFMGYKVVDKPKVVNGENFFEYIDENGNYTYCNSLLKYDTSWDWLMPVVEKIESLRDLDGNAYRFSIDMCNVSIENTDIEILGGDFKINTTYNAVVEFIKTHKNK
jgi:hypothetical protein